LATAQDERILNEKRRHGDAPFDVRPVRGASLDDLDLGRFQFLYLPNAFDPDVLERNDRTVEERLAATKMIVSVDDPTPTTLGVLMLGRKPMHFLPGAYLQLLRFDGEDRSAPVIDARRCEGPVTEALNLAGMWMQAHVRTSVEFGGTTTEIRRSTHAFTALQELVHNAAMHRAYEASNSPIQVCWFSDRIEIISPGGPFGDVTVDNFGRPGRIGYRNPNLADAMRVMGLVQRYGAGIPLARRALQANNQAEPEFEVDAQRVSCTVRTRPDWPGNVPGLAPGAVSAPPSTGASAG